MRNEESQRLNLILFDFRKITARPSFFFQFERSKRKDSKKKRKIKNRGRKIERLEIKKEKN